MVLHKIPLFIKNFNYKQNFNTIIKNSQLKICIIVYYQQREDREGFPDFCRTDRRDTQWEIRKSNPQPQNRVTTASRVVSH